MHRGTQVVNNISDAGTEGTKISTTGKDSTQGQFRFNTTTALAEYYDTQTLSR